MADKAIETARAQRDAADRTLAEHNLKQVEAARAIVDRMVADRADLKQLAEAMDPGPGRDGLRHLVEMIGSVDLSLQHERDLHSRTLTRLG